jgi:hypothetical protein
MRLAKSRSMGSAGPVVSSGDPLQGAERELYHVVAQRRLQFDNLIWQVPVVSLTGQAFLFTIALSADNSQLARAISSALALVAALLSMQIMARHRQAEITDAHWLRDYETANFRAVVHGPTWGATRNANPISRPFSLLKGFQAWMLGFGLFAAAAATIFVVSLVAPAAF